MERNVCFRKYFFLIWSIDWLFDWLIDWLVFYYMYFSRMICECGACVFLWVHMNMYEGFLFMQNEWFHYILEKKTISFFCFFIRQQPRSFCANKTSFFPSFSSYNSAVGKIHYCISVRLCMFSLIKIEWVYVCSRICLQIQSSMDIHATSKYIVYNIQYANTHAHTHIHTSTHIFINFYPFEKWNIKVWSSFRATWFMWFYWGGFLPFIHFLWLLIKSFHDMNVSRYTLSFHTCEDVNAWVYVCVLLLLLTYYFRRSQFVFFKSNVNQMTERLMKCKFFFHFVQKHPNMFVYILLHMYLSDTFLLLGVFYACAWLLWLLFICCERCWWRWWWWWYLCVWFFC